MITNTDIQANDIFTELTPQEVESIHGGERSTGEVVGAIVGGVIGLGGGAFGTMVGVAAGSKVGDLLNDLYDWIVE